MSKYQRENFTEKEIVEGIHENDLVNNGFSDFDFEGKIGSYVVTESDIQRPDLISRKVYGSQNAWWILLKYNKVEDIWNDLFVGMVLDIPSPEKIEEYYRKRL